MTKEEAATTLAQLVDEGWLIGIAVFGADDCCEHGDYTECPADGFGLMDVYSKNSPGMSDCNRAERWMLRPKDGLMTDHLCSLINDPPR